MNIRSLKPRRNIQVWELDYRKAGDGSTVLLRSPRLSRSAEWLLGYMAKRCRSKLWNLSPSIMNPEVLYWIPLRQPRRRLEFRFETPLAAAMFQSLYNTQVRTRTRPSAEPASPASALAQDAS